MRLFVAIEMPDEAIAELRRLQKELDLFGLRPVKDFHLTLKFLGDVPESKIGRLKELLSQIRFTPFEAELSEIGVFPEPDYIRVIWAGIKGDQIFSIQKDIDTQLEQMGFGRDNKFKPHLTLARVNFIKDKNALSKRLNALDVKPIKFKVEDFKLIQSTLTLAGPVYDTQAVFNGK